MTLRKLGSIETALLLTDEFAVMNVVVVLQLDGTLKPEILRQALDFLQKRHVLLQAHIQNRTFIQDSSIPIPLEQVVRADDTSWITITEKWLNQKFNIAEEPLMRCILLAGDHHHELVLVFQHTIIDGDSGTAITHELLCLYADLDAGKTPEDKSPEQVFPPAEALFPARYRGLAMTLRLPLYMLRQMVDEISYRLGTKKQQQAIIQESGRCQIFSFSFDADFTNRLVRYTRLHHISINSLLQAAMLMAVQQHLYPPNSRHSKAKLRSFTFASLRPYLSPPMPIEHVGTYISMLRFGVTLQGQSLETLAQQIHKLIYLSWKRGEKYIATQMSPYVIQMLVKMRSFRMGATALSYTGVSTLNEVYGTLQVRGLHGFISNNVLGPEYTMRAGLFDECIVLDVLTLDSDMNRLRMEQITHTIHDILNSNLSGATTPS